MAAYIGNWLVSGGVTRSSLAAKTKVGTSTLAAAAMAEGFVSAAAKFTTAWMEALPAAPRKLFFAAHTRC